MSLRATLLITANILMMSPSILAQAEMEGWGNLNGIRVEGQLMPFETSIMVVSADWSQTKKTAKERQRPIYNREGPTQSVSTRIDSLYINISVEDTGKGKADMAVDLDCRIDTTMAGVYLGIKLPAKYYEQGSLTIGDEIISLSSLLEVPQEYSGSQLLLKSPNGNLTVSTPETQSVLVFKDTATASRNDLLIYISLVTGAIHTGMSASGTYTFTVEVEDDDDQATLILDSSVPGKVFDGLGGNFRLQNPQTDPPVIDYCLNNLRVAWARVEMPWFFWHSEEDKDPLAAARAGDIHPRVVAAMEMAQRLDSRGIPVMIADWSAPNWAIVGERSSGPQAGGLRGNPLDQKKAEKIYRSIGDYVQYMKEKYGVEAQMFSFNESDLGINVRQTPEEHTRLLLELGAHFRSRGLSTKLLLGDTADANGWPFIDHAMNDLETYPYIGAVSFHSWRGWTDETLGKWAAAADRVNKPLVVGEGSIDAAAWRFPKIFEEPTYARAEINLYIRILAICQPLSILQWQLTADYSVLSGGGVFGNNEQPLHPTQRFWNLKQLASTPHGLRFMPISSDNAALSAAALGDVEKRNFVVHIVNNGASRRTTLSGIPKKVKRFWVYTTDHDRGMEVSRIKVKKGVATFTTEAVSYTTLSAVKFL